MTASKHRRTCEELGVCQNRDPRCSGCKPIEEKDIPPMVAAAMCFAALLVMHFGGWIL
jgi:hypothetical protein